MPTVLLVNLGTPQAPTASALRSFLREFLSDPRVVEKPRLLWWFILNALILPMAPARSARRYCEIWTKEGSPLLVLSERLRDKVARELADDERPFDVVLGMRYGKPSIAGALEDARRSGCSELICVPLYPQYSAATTGSVFDALADELKTWRRVPGLDLISDYHDEPGYIEALASSAREFWAEHGEPERLLISMHSVPTRFVAAGDPYQRQCERTAELLADQLGLGSGRWKLTYQSRFGRESWIGPATDGILEGLPSEGVKRVDVICPGFAVDCIETVGEIAVEARRLFVAAGGRELRLIPCLNDDSEHAAFLARLVRPSIITGE